MIGDYFVVDNINNQTYVFKLDGARIKTTKQRVARPFQTVDYDISHYLPISSDNKLIELTEKINSLPRISGKLHNILKILGRTEKDDFGKYVVKDVVFDSKEAAEKYKEKENIKDPVEFRMHNLVKLVETLSNSKEKYQKEIAEMMNYFARLNVDQIVTPLRRLSDFIEDDLKTTDPRYGGAIFDAAIEADNENRKITNSPKTAKKSLFMLVAIPLILILVGVVIYQAYELGMFDNIWSSIQPSFGAASDDQIMQQYPNCPSLRAAVDSGKVNYDSLSKAVQDVYNSCPAPGGK